MIFYLIYFLISLIFIYLNNKQIIYGNEIPGEKYLRDFTVILCGFLWPLMGWLTIYCCIKIWIESKRLN